MWLPFHFGVFRLGSLRFSVAGATSLEITGELFNHKSWPVLYPQTVFGHGGTSGDTCVFFYPYRRSLPSLCCHKKVPFRGSDFLFSECTATRGGFQGLTSIVWL